MPHSQPYVVTAEESGRDWFLKHNSRQIRGKIVAYPKQQLPSPAALRGDCGGVGDGTASEANFEANSMLNRGVVEATAFCRNPTR